jgi:glycosyltransferase involved in cell wall biosynthesis
LSNSLFFEKKFPQIAIGWAEKAVSLEPDSLQGCYVLGSSYCRLGQPDKAIEFFGRILKPLEDALALNRLDPRKAEFSSYEHIAQCYLASCTRLATCYMKQGQYDKVEQIYARLLDNPHVEIPESEKRGIERICDRLCNAKSDSDSELHVQCAAKTPEGMCSEPKVSVITSCHNSERYLRECLDSIRNQTLQQWELFLIDDGSADGTKEIIQQYSRMDNRIKPYFFSDNKGPYVRRNFAIQQANADFIVIQDADDMMCPSKLQVLYEHINADAQLGAVGAFYGLFLEEFKGIKHTDTRELPLEHNEIVAKWSAWQHAMSQGSAIIRKRLFETIGPYDENPFGADAFWFAKAAEYAKHNTGLKFKNLPECLSLIRLRQGSQTASLPVYDPRSRRFRYKLYCEYKLRQLREELATSSGVGIEAELRNCVCSDFRERFKDHIIQWENEPLDDAVISRLLDNAVALFNRSYFVSCVSVLNDIEVMSAEAAKRFRNFDLLRAMALFAVDTKKRSLEYLHQELQHHDNPAARQFIQDCFDNQPATSVLKWCAEHGDLYELRMVDTQRVSQAI